jgi:hypothetical protein
VRSDAQPLERVVNRDRGAFHLFLERHSDRVFRFALSPTRSPHLAEEPEDADSIRELLDAVSRGIPGVMRGIQHLVYSPKQSKPLALSGARLRETRAARCPRRT